MVIELKSFADLEKVTVEEGELTILEDPHELRRERRKEDIDRNIWPARDNTLLNPPRAYNACYAEFKERLVDGETIYTLVAHLGYRWANSLSSRSRFEYGKQKFQFDVPTNKKDAIRTLGETLRRMGLHVLILRNPANPRSIVGHSFHW